MIVPNPIKNRIIIQRDTKSDRVYLSEFGLWIYQSNPQPKFWGKIVSLPEVLTVNEGSEILEVGMTVLFQPHVSIDFECDGNQYVSVRFIDILAIMEE